MDVLGCTPQACKACTCPTSRPEKRARNWWQRHQEFNGWGSSSDTPPRAADSRQDKAVVFTTTGRASLPVVGELISGWLISCQGNYQSGDSSDLKIRTVTSWGQGEFSSIQLLSGVWLFVTPWTAACQASLSITNSQSLLKLMSIELVMPSNHLILCHPLLLLPSIFPSIRGFSNESVLRIRWPNSRYWSSIFSISPSSEYSGLISFRMDWLDLFAVQGTLMSFLQHRGSKASVLWCSAFFTV